MNSEIGQNDWMKFQIFITKAINWAIDGDDVPFIRSKQFLEGHELSNRPTQCEDETEKNVVDDLIKKKENKTLIESDEQRLLRFILKVRSERESKYHRDILMAKLSILMATFFVIAIRKSHFFSAEQWIYILFVYKRMTKWDNEKVTTKIEKKIEYFLWSNK